MPAFSQGRRTATRTILAAGLQLFSEGLVGTDTETVACGAQGTPTVARRRRGLPATLPRTTRPSSNPGRDMPGWKNKEGSTALVLSRPAAMLQRIRGDAAAERSRVQLPSGLLRNTGASS
eukprot:365858-Chlamydomonas_euryale.AAC.2